MAAKALTGDVRCIRVLCGSASHGRSAHRQPNLAAHAPAAWQSKSACRDARPSKRRSLASHASASQPSDPQDSADPDTPLTFPSQAGDNQAVMLKYVTEVEPSVVDVFERTAPSEVTEATRMTVGSLLGSLPPRFFEVNIVTLGDNLRGLMHSFLITGYVYRYMFDKMDVHTGLSRALPAGPLADSSGDEGSARPASLQGGVYAEGASTAHVSGHVTRWHYQNGVEDLSAKEYIKALEQEVASLRQQVDRPGGPAEASDSDDGEPNELIRAMRRESQQRLQAARPGPCVAEAMEVFLQRLLGTDDAAELSSMVSETTAKELQHLLQWILIVGYTLRAMETRLTMESSLALPLVALEDRGLRDGI